MEMLEMLKIYSEKGWKIFPIKEKKKVPAIKDWQNLATDNWANISEWYEYNNNYNWGIATGETVVIDIDTYKGGVLDSRFPETLTSCQ